MSLLSAIANAATSGNQLSPQITTSLNYKHWVSVEDWKRCFECAKNHGKIWLITETPYSEPPTHPNCRCKIKLMQAITAGTATIDGVDGADWRLKYECKLPNYYISSYNASLSGWKPGKWPSNFVPGKMLTLGNYKNFNGHLPYANGRIWYEADINYKTGQRNSQRILWSNDGLIFVTYDHYQTFYEII
ncbi:MAG: phage head morphogenesis protein [Oscillospiraceae bacterium]|nr:phage head morphogenesis protein [Oscillospiraceae bacterium]